MNLTERMKVAKDKTSLTTSDMAHWFGVSRAAMNTWLSDGASGGHAPHPTKEKLLEPLLAVLERVADPALELFPVPLNVRQYERAEYVGKVRNHAIAKFSKVRLARAGDKMRGGNSAGR